MTGVTVDFEAELLYSERVPCDKYRMSRCRQSGHRLKHNWTNGQDIAKNINNRIVRTSFKVKQVKLRA
jgi:hypothetical protein